MTLGTVTGVAAAHTVMVTLEPLPTDAPPAGFWITTLPLSALLQSLVVVGTTVSLCVPRIPSTALTSRFALPAAWLVVGDLALVVASDARDGTNSA
jgi:hypothetical protein